MTQSTTSKTIGKNKQVTNMSALLLLILTGFPVFSQNYTWMKGATVTDQGGIYGTLGVSAAANTPGARDIPVSWKDANGNFWLFGGEGYDATGTYGNLNDLWKYTTTTNQWTWISGSSVADQNGVYGTMGSPAPLNIPGSRVGASSWVDGSGNLWLFGGNGFDAFGNSGEMNDLWRYNIAGNQWTWVKGSNNALQIGVYGTQGTAASANIPGGRSDQCSWADAAGNFWLFGGIGYGNSTNAYGDLNDLWKYNITTNQWTWMKGSTLNDQSGIYGSIGVSAVANCPGGRYLTAAWRDVSGNLWLAGGAGYDQSSNNEDLLNDLWKYNVASNQWAWVNGSNASGQSGIYGTLGAPATSNVPGGRAGTFSWTDASGNFFLFGGLGYDVTSTMDFLNDIWKYNLTTNQWTWMKGSSAASQNGVYGTQGVAASANSPGARGGGTGWTDASLNLWLFGGFGYDNVGVTSDDLNDLWRLGSCTNFPTVSITTNTSSLCNGSSATLTAAGANTYSWSNSQTGAVNVVSPANTGANIFTSYGTDLNGCSASASISINVFALPIVTAITSKSQICRFIEQATLTATGAGVYSWSTVPANTNASIVVSPTITTIYTVIGTDLNGCSNTFSITQFVASCLGIDEISNASSPYFAYPNPNNGAFMISGYGPIHDSKVIIYNTLGQKVFEKNLSAAEVEIQTHLQTGIYQFNIIQADTKVSSGKIVIE